MANKLAAKFSLDRYGLHTRFVDEDDAEFILKLRTDDKLLRFLNATSPDIEAQRNWTRGYKEREKKGEDYYFIFEIPEGIPVGVCRIYDIHESEFTIGSWLFGSSAPIGAAILADIITREIAFDLMPQSRLLFDVRVGNINVLRYQNTYRPVILKETEQDVFFELSRENFEKYKRLHLRMFAPKIK